MTQRMIDLGSLSSLWNNLLGFLKRDIRSFFRKTKWTLPTPPLEPLPPLLDPSQLNHLRHRRAILDWRDETILNLGLTAKKALKDFYVRLEALFDEVSLWRRVWPKPANEVLQVDFDSKVILVIRSEAVQARKRLSNLLVAQEISNLEPTLLQHESTYENLNCIAGLGFKSANYDKMRSEIDSLVMNDQGVTLMFQRQIQKIADDLIRKVSM